MPLRNKAEMWARTLVPGARRADASAMAHNQPADRQRERIEAVALDLEGQIADFFGDVRSQLSSEQWKLLSGYARARIRQALELGLSLHAVVDKHEGQGTEYPGRGRDTFVRAALAAWTDSYSPVPDCWRLVEVFERVDGGELRVLADVATLEVMAANRMFASLDEQIEGFLQPDS